jgi:sirohydrochlorin cobaltochelatase
MRHTVIVLAMHGAPPNDFPRRDMGEFFSLHMQLDRGTVVEERRPQLEARYAELDAKMCAWPRSAKNDPFHAASYALAEKLSLITGWEVIVGFNEFCAPRLGDALDEAAAREADEVVVITPMLTPGGEHAEIDIPAAIEQAEECHPDAAFRYAWPFEIEEVAQCLATQMHRHV